MIQSHTQPKEQPTMTRRPRNHHLTAAIAKSGMTITEVAAAARISRCHLSRLLAWRSIPCFSTAMRLAEALGTPVDALGLDTAPNCGVFIHKNFHDFPSSRKNS